MRRRSERWSWSIALLVACSSGGSGPAGTGGGGTGAASGGSAGSGGTGGAGIHPRACGDAVACATGATCKIWHWETATECACDGSGHFLCNAAPGGAAGPSVLCREEAPCFQASDSCVVTNGFCEKTCTCDGAVMRCREACDGAGPARNGVPCSRESCQTDPSDITTYFGGCEVRDGACSYSISCNGDDEGVCAPP